MQSAFEQLGLRAELITAVAQEGYTEPTPIQAQAIPVVLEGRDVLAAAQTGTGKTAAFTLPILQALATRATGSPSSRPIRALVLTPTRELAAQVEDSVRTYGRHLKIRSTTVFGGVSAVHQVRAIRDGVDVLVATPGRLLDLMQQRAVDLTRIEILVLDEADRMLDMGFIRDIRKVLQVLPAKRQNLLFSATFSTEIRSLASSFLTSPVEVSVARENATAELVSQVVHPVDKGMKRDLLAHLITEGDWKQVLVFTRTKHGANRLAQDLDRAGITAGAIHGNKSQNARTRVLQDFKDGRVRVLVATDIAARGLDIEELPHVVNYELPNIPEDYVHRIGRTGRAGSSGQACSLVCGEEAGFLRDIERLMKRQVDKVYVSGFEPRPGQPVEEELTRQGQRRSGGGGGGRGRSGGGGPGRSGSGRSSGGRSGSSSSSRGPRQPRAQASGPNPQAPPARAPSEPRTQVRGRPEGQGTPTSSTPRSAEGSAPPRRSIGGSRSGAPRVYKRRS